ncbi:hypothetical protein [Palleronia marisminoris]|nr:hypothetical protein [Palleronia marisminoris]
MDTTVGKHADIEEGSPLDVAIRGRADIFKMTQAAEDAVLRPHETGAWPHPLRAALAARIAALNDEHELSRHYAADAAEFAAHADPSTDGGDLKEVVAFMEKVAAQTRSVDAEDISALKATGIDDADIVRLAELNAFLSYQIRLIAGLRLMKGASA